MSTKIKIQAPGLRDNTYDKENQDTSNLSKKNKQNSNMLEPKEFPVDKIRVFLGDTDSPSVAEEKPFQKNTDNLEEIILKQNFLEKNQLFNPTEYFGGLVISDLGNYSPDKRLEEMFEEYLPTEEDLMPEDDKPVNMNTNMNKLNHPGNYANKNQLKPNSNPNVKACFNKKNNLACSKTFQSNKENNNTLKLNEQKNIKKFGPQISAQSSADKLKFLFKDNLNDKSLTKKTASFLNSKASINLSTLENIGEKIVESTRVLESNIAQKLANKPPKTKVIETKVSQVKSGSDLGSNKSQINDKTNASKLLGSSLSPRNILSTQPMLKSAKSREETYSAERKIEKERCLRSKDKNFFSFTQNTMPDEDIESNYNAFSRDYSRPKTANPSFIEDATPLIKCIISPKFCKTPQIETNKSLISSTKQDEKKISTSNPLKFFNDFLNKSKLNNVNSSNHIKMPKKYTFIESKQHESTSNSSDGNRPKIEKEKSCNKSTLQSSGNNFQQFTNITSAKRLFGNKNTK